jgi:hypothetical protein
MMTGIRLPRAWRPLADGSPVAALPGTDGDTPAGVLTVRRVAGEGSPPLPCSAAVAALREAVPDLIVLDESTVRCRGGTTAQRTLLAHVHKGRGVTTEVWSFTGPAPAIVCVAVDTRCYADQRPGIHRALRGFRS